MRTKSCVIALAATLPLAAQVASAGRGPAALLNMQPFKNESGQSRTFSAGGVVDTDTPFFRNLGNNGRACVNCHEPGEGWSISPPSIQARFNATGGMHPLFRLVDGANVPNAPVGTVAERRASYSLLLNKGLIRVSMPIPGDAEFRLAEVDDPYHRANAGEINMYRRPLPTTNVNFVSALMWDGRESAIPAANVYVAPQDEHFRNQSQSAVSGHAEGGSITSDVRQAMVGFQRSLTTAQTFDSEAGDLTAQGAKGGPLNLSRQRFYMGINDSISPDPTGAPSTKEAFTLYKAWLNLPGNSKTARARRAIARGEELFNNKEIRITGVSGVNDDLNAPLVVGTCTTCHDTPNVGNHSMRRPLNIGVSDVTERTPDLPLYTLERLDANGNPTGELKQVSDPGRAMITGKWKDVARFKGPVLRGLATRAPYFHNGMAANLMEAVEFYNRRFEIELTEQEKSDMVAFLRAL